MEKVVKLKVKCPKCASLSAVQVKEKEIGGKKQVICPKCRNIFAVNIPTSFIAKFVSDPTIGGLEDDKVLLLEVIGNNETSFQSFELTADTYTIGRKNNSGPAYRPDIEVLTNDYRMSRKHAVIRKKGKVGFSIMDLGSKNGIILNGGKIAPDEEIYLNDGDIFLLGDTQFRVSFSEKSDDYNDLTN